MLTPKHSIVTARHDPWVYEICSLYLIPPTYAPYIVIILFWNLFHSILLPPVKSLLAFSALPI